MKSLSFVVVLLTFTFSVQSALSEEHGKDWSHKRQEQVAQLRAGTDVLFKRESFVLRHDFRTTQLWLDLDLTALPTSKQAEGSQKGKIGDKKIAMGDN